ncbi:MAG: zinc-ribbon domain-containing protein [Thermoplasmata archaeon]
MAVATCPRCGAQNAADDVFCAKCGTTLHSQPAGTSYPTSQATPLAPPPWASHLQGTQAMTQAWPGPSPSDAATSGGLQRPTASMVLAIVGGVFIIALAILEVNVGAQDAQLTLGYSGGTYIISGLLGIVFGILVLVFGILVYLQPQHHVVYGVLILVFSVFSLVSLFGGFFIGFVLGLIGGILAIVHKPILLQPIGQFVVPPIQRVCPKCGRVIDPYVKFCPHCGNQLG